MRTNTHPPTRRRRPLHTGREIDPGGERQHTPSSSHPHGSVPCADTITARFRTVDRPSGSRCRLTTSATSDGDGVARRFRVAGPPGFSRVASNDHQPRPVTRGLPHHRARAGSGGLETDCCGHTWASPARQNSQRPQPQTNGTVTRSFACRRVTSGPTSAIVPANSCPGTCGSCTGSWPCQACQSERQTPVGGRASSRSSVSWHGGRAPGGSR